VIASERADFRLVLGDQRRIGVELVRALNPLVARGAGSRKRLRATIERSLQSDGVWL
jgi:hypothetical protein